MIISIHAGTESAVDSLAAGATMVSALARQPWAYTAHLHGPRRSPLDDRDGSLSSRV